MCMCTGGVSHAMRSKIYMNMCSFARLVQKKARSQAWDPANDTYLRDGTRLSGLIANYNYRETKLVNLRKNNKVSWLPKILRVGFLLVFQSNSLHGILGQDLGGPAKWAKLFVPMGQCVVGCELCEDLMFRVPSNCDLLCIITMSMSLEIIVRCLRQYLKNSNWIQFPIPNTQTQVTVEKCMTTRPAHHAWAACTATST